MSSDKKQGLKTPTLESLSGHASAFAKSVADTFMVAAAFCSAAVHFAGGKTRKKRVAEIELNKATMAPSLEAGLATIAINLTYGAQMVLLSDTDNNPSAHRLVVMASSIVYHKPWYTKSCT